MSVLHRGSIPQVFVALVALCIGHALELSLSPDELKALQSSQPCAVGSPQAGGFANPFPGCMCPMGLRGHTGVAVPVPGAPPVLNITGPILKPGELEVVTVDVKTANWVRCNNVSVATSIAQLLKIPLKRVTVTPWSWTPEVPQENYLAFVQEDHERCDCDAGDGRTVQGAGFRRVESAQARDGIAPADTVANTTVMTVAQYNAMMAAQAAPLIPTPIPLPFAAMANGTIPAPPRGTVQMVTRDPCLVKLLRLYPDWFRQRLASLLQVPADFLLINPPPVQGTVGLLQLDSSLIQEATDASRKVKQVPVLAVHQCSDMELHVRMHRLHMELGLLSERQQPQYVVAMNATNATGMMNYTVSPNVSNATNATPEVKLPVTPQRVFLAMNLTNIDYDKFAEQWSLIDAFDTIVKGAIGATGHVPSDTIKMALYPGSIEVEAVITPPPNTAPLAILAFLNGTVCSEMEGRLNAMVALSPVTTGFISCSQLELKLLDPPFEPEEKNRAWVAFWNVVALPPYADYASWDLLNLANDPQSEVTKLLPMTLARVPGLRYRAIKPYNAANETRLPPPLDKALRFKLPSPINEEAALEHEMERMKKEEQQADLVIQDEAAAERMRIDRVMRAAAATRVKIAMEDAKIVKSAKLHVAELFNGTLEGEAPDIVPWGVLTGHNEDADSPYPWQQQIPPPQIYTGKTGLVQRKQKVLRR